jgi:hypothetical protein
MTSTNSTTIPASFNIGKDLAIKVAKETKTAVKVGNIIHDYSKWPAYMKTYHYKFDEIFNQ